MGYYLTEPMPARPAEGASARPSDVRKKKGLGAPFLQAILSTKYCDSDLGLYYFGYRFFSPGLGRWMGRDPIGEWGELSLYSYCYQSPLNYSDTLGRIAWDFGKHCKLEHQQKFKDIDKQFMDSLEKAIKLVEQPDAGGPQESIMKECFGSSSGFYGYEIALRKVFGNLKKLKSIFEKKEIQIACDPCCDEGTTGWVLMLGSIALTDMRICTSWIEEADSKQLAGSLLHESTHEYLGFRGGEEWYYMESGGWISPDGNYYPGVTPPNDVIFSTPDAYKCLFWKNW